MASAPVNYDQKPPPYDQQPPQQPFIQPQPPGTQQGPFPGQPGGVPMQAQRTIVITSGMVPMLSYNPQSIQCGSCHAQIVTRVEFRSGLLTWLVCGAICFFGGIFGCCLIPFCIDDLKDAEHYCPNCNQFLGARRRMG